MKPNRLSSESQSRIRELIPNYGSLTDKEVVVEAAKVILKDFYLFTEKNLMITDKDGALVPLRFKWAQRQFIEAVMDDLLNDRPIRYIILKARQMGFSTVIEALCYWWTTTHNNVNSVIIAHKKNAAKNLYKMFRRYYTNCDPMFRPVMKYNTKDDLTFDVSDEVKAEYESRGQKSPGLSSEIQTMVASEGGGRSNTIHFFHGSECAFWDAGADVLSSALQAIPLRANTFAFLESTANGIGGYFYDEWQNAKKGDSIFKPMFFAWHEDPEYAIDNGPIKEYTEEEQGLLKIFEEKGYPKETWDPKIHFWRVKKQEFRSRPDELYQEYPKNDIEAFLASGRSKFDKQALMKMEEIANLPENQPKFGIIHEKDHKITCRLTEATESDPKPTPLKVWELPKVGHRYVMGVDTSEGIAGGATGKEGDYSVIDIMDVSNLKTVARWRGHIDPDLLGDLCVQLGTYYNYALIGPEINNHGLTTTQRIRDKFYRNLFMRETSEEEQFQERTSKMGWKTDRKTKPLMINDLAAAIRENDIIDLDIVFIRECITYVVDDQGRTNAQEGMFDDTVMAKAISLQLAQWSHLDTERIKVHKKTTRNRNATRTRASNSYKVTNSQGYERTKATRSRARRR